MSSSSTTRESLIGGNSTASSPRRTPCVTPAPPVLGDKEFHVAPMMGVSYREFRHFVRLLTRRATLWTEMIVDDTILHTTDLEYHLGFDRQLEPPVICQIGGNQEQYAAAVTRTVVHEYGYAECNLNAGCPSHRVATKRAFGAALLQNVPKAKAMLRAMQEGIQIDNDDQQQQHPKQISIKLRVGVDDDDDWEWTHQLIAQLSTACQRFYVHARKVHTAGLDAAQNRRIPPLDYPRVYALCRAFPECDFWINGGILTLAHAKDVCFGIAHGDPAEDNRDAQQNGDEDNETPDHCAGLIPPGHGCLPCPMCQQPNGSCITAPLIVPPPNLRGCMVGRAVLDDPMQFATLDTDFYGETHNPSLNRRHVLQQYATYLKQLYPRRCGEAWWETDSDASSSLRVTLRPPGIRSLHDYFCEHCQQGTQKRPSILPNHVPHQSPPRLMHQLVIGRAFKPVHGVFSGMPGMPKAWRRLLQLAMTQEKECLNCGPGFLLQRTVERLEEDGNERVTAILDRPFGQQTDENTQP